MFVTGAGAQLVLIKKQLSKDAIYELQDELRDWSKSVWHPGQIFRILPS